MSTRVTRADLPLLRRTVRQFKELEGSPAYAQAPGALAFVAHDGLEILGWCWGYLLPRPDGLSMMYLHELEVAEAHRRKGLGRELLCAFMTEGSKVGATKMFLFTAADNVAARSLYESLGGGLASQGDTVNYWFRLESPSL